jgi:hypothetical protein
VQAINHHFTCAQGRLLTLTPESDELHARRYHRQGRRPQARSVESIADGNGILVKKNFIGEKRNVRRRVGCLPESAGFFSLAGETGNRSSSDCEQSTTRIAAALKSAKRDESNKRRKEARHGRTAGGKQARGHAGAVRPRR